MLRTGVIVGCLPISTSFGRSVSVQCCCGLGWSVRVDGQKRVEAEQSREGLEHLIVFGRNG